MKFEASEGSQFTQTNLSQKPFVPLTLTTAILSAFMLVPRTPQKAVALILPFQDFSISKLGSRRNLNPSISGGVLG